MTKVLVVDDELSIVEVLKTVLKRNGYEVTATDNGATALDIMKTEKFELMISDIRMKPMDGLELLINAKEIQPTLSVIMMTAYATIETAVETMKAGAYDYVCKPFKIDELLLTVERAVNYQKVFKENQDLKKTLQTKYHFKNLIGDSSQMQSVYNVIKKVSKTDTTVLIRGESGTGKELVSKAIHYCSSRSDRPIVAVNCAALPSTLLESELFGYNKGAFTGAVKDKEGLFESAGGGTIFLDEIGSIPVTMQMKLLRVLQEKTIRRVGGTKDVAVDVRIISATNEDLEAKIKDGTFREDLFYRLSVIPVDLPSLRERKEDVPLLVVHFLKDFNTHENTSAEILPDALRALLAYDWPGNVRELENVIRRAATLCDNDMINLEDLPPKIQDVNPIDNYTSGVNYRGHSLKNYLREKEKEYIQKVLEVAGGEKEKAADMLGVSLATFYRKYESVE
ncbi:MAG: sigma-54 dependent transcriptional regulator [Lentisphaeraceae bacterium]|nr:sigma-54 dependent transcriptional regulator [Lentisphaeraceae bacterium]